MLEAIEWSPKKRRSIRNCGRVLLMSSWLVLESMGLNFTGLKEKWDRF